MAFRVKTFGDLKFYIDRPKGYIKKWPNRTFVYPVDYGYFKQIKGEDGEGLDAFVGDDLNGHFESFLKLKEDGTPDETKFLIGINDEDRNTIYSLYGKEAFGRKVYKSLEGVKRALEAFKPSKKARYTHQLKQAAMQALSDMGINLKYLPEPARADILTKIDRGFERIDSTTSPTTTESSAGSLFQQDVM